MRWRLFQGVALPYSRTDGPLRVSGPVYAGYTHTPAGALIAASQLVARVLITPGSGWRQVVDKQLVPNQGREVYRRLRAQVTDASSSHYAQLAGFRFITYDPSTAVVGLVNLSSNGELRTGTVTVRWLDGDWKLQLDATGDQGPPIQTIPNLGGYAPWRGAS